MILRDGLLDSARCGTLETFLKDLTAVELSFLLYDWQIWARDDQLPPDPGSKSDPWTSWLILGGRGAGKTRAGAEWIRAKALGLAPIASEPCFRIALVGETFGDVRSVMIEGVSGLLAVHPPDERPRFEVSRRRLEWPNGAVAQIFSAEEPEGLRGPQFGAAWSDEIAKWRHGEKCWDMLQFGLRLGSTPQQVATTTPKPVPLVKRLLADPEVVTTRARTDANAANLAPVFLKAIISRYRGTRLGRQELEAEFIEDRSDSLWKREQMEHCHDPNVPDLCRIVVAVDPPVTSGTKADACGIIGAGRTYDDKVWIMKDETVEHARPIEWAEKSVGTYRALCADCIVTEVNQGGELVRQVIHQVDPFVPVRMVRATRGKWVRAEPVAALYEQGRVFHACRFALLEDQMCDFGRDGLSDGSSPDRVDALVWALTELMLNGSSEPRLRIL